MNNHSPCIMQPQNHGLICDDGKLCETCGWNPSVAAKRKKQREDAERLCVPLHCVGCILVTMCKEAGCLKEGCQHKKTEAAALSEIKEEQSTLR